MQAVQECCRTPVCGDRDCDEASGSVVLSILTNRRRKCAHSLGGLWRRNTHYRTAYFLEAEHINASTYSLDDGLLGSRVTATLSINFMLAMIRRRWDRSRR